MGYIEMGDYLYYEINMKCAKWQNYVLLMGVIISKVIYLL